MTSVAKDRNQYPTTTFQHQKTNYKITKLQIIRYNYFLLYSLNYLNTNNLNDNFCCIMIVWYNFNL